MRHKRKLIEAREIPHADQRYPTCGDYWNDPTGCLQVRVSSMPDWRYVWLIMVHEIIEQGLCREAGITHKEIDAFDKKFERERTKGKHKTDDEPGDDPRAPYRSQHLTATGIEKMLAAAMGVDWKAYDKAVNSL